LPEVVEVRGWGLLLAAELLPGIPSAEVARRSLDAGVVVNAVSPTALRFAPSLLIEQDQLDEAVAILADVLTEVAAESAGESGEG
ncbi:hypothetical protein B7486_62475, partial [cyanobacterium TDX16]